MAPGRRSFPHLALLLCCLSGWAAAQQAASPSASALIAEMAEAYHERTFQGRFLYMRGNEVITLSLKHALIDGKEYEHLSHLAGRPTEVIRAGGEAVCIHPDRSVTRLPEVSGTAAPALARKLMKQLPEQYDVLLDGNGRVAGREAWRLRLAPLDEHRYGYRLWVDRDSRLLLKSELVDSSGVALERIEFVVLELDPTLTAEDFRMPGPEQPERALPMQRTDAGVVMETGWLPGGFVRASGTDRRPVNGREALVSETFSDGLAAFTLFVEPDGVDISEGISRLGPTVALTRRLTGERSGYVVTLVGEVPQQTAEKVMNELALREAAND